MCLFLEIWKYDLSALDFVFSNWNMKSKLFFLNFGNFYLEIWKYTSFSLDFGFFIGNIQTTLDFVFFIGNMKIYFFCSCLFSLEMWKYNSFTLGFIFCIEKYIKNMLLLLQILTILFRNRDRILFFLILLFLLRNMEIL